MIFFGYGQEALPGARRRSRSSIAGAGVFAFAIHTVFIAHGNPEFGFPVSQALLVATLLLSIARAAVVARCARPG